MFKEPVQSTDPWWQKIDFLALHLVTCTLIFMVFKTMGHLALSPLGEKLYQWDTGWYDSIRLMGYQFSATEQSNSGFFPLFPYLWRWSGLGVVGIALFNTLLVFISWFLLYREFHFRKIEFLIAISIPSVFFLYVPYTESLFFFGSTLTLIGIRRDKPYPIFIGLLVSSMTRSTAVFLVPALVYMVALSTDRHKIVSGQQLKRLILFLVPLLLAVTLVVFWQWFETGVWLAYFKAQSTHWFRGLSMPAFPLSTWNHPKILWADALAFLIAGVACWMVLNRLWGWLRGKRYDSGQQTLYLSEGYLCMVFFSLLLVNPKNLHTGLTEISGANRYLFTTPFFFLFLQHLVRGHYQLKGWSYLVIPPVFLLFNIYNIHQITVFAGLAILTCMVVAIARKDVPSYWTFVLYLIFMCLQFYLFDLFIKGQWVG